MSRRIKVPDVTLGIKPILKRTDSFYIDGVEVAWVPGNEERLAISRDGKMYRAPRTDKLGRHFKGYWLRLSKDRASEYIQVTSMNGCSCLHEAVALTWVYNTNKSRCTQVDHADQDPKNNDSSNLRWLDPAENSHNSAASSGRKKGDGLDPEKKKAEQKRQDEKKKNDPVLRAQITDKERERRRKRRAEMTEEEREEERHYQREWARANRAKKKAQKEAQAQAEAGE